MIELIITSITGVIVLGIWCALFVEAHGVKKGLGMAIGVPAFISFIIFVLLCISISVMYTVFGVGDGLSVLFS